LHKKKFCKEIHFKDLPQAFPIDPNLV